MDKSASFLHILPFIFLYILKNHQKQIDAKCDEDKLYNLIPDKTKVNSKKEKVSSNIKYILSVIPIVYLLIKSQDNKPLEHTFVVLSYAIALKTAIHFMTPCIPKQDFTNIANIVILLNMRYFNIIPSEHMTGGYLLTVLYSLFLISQRETTSANIIMDYTFAHFVFLYAKMF